MATPYPLGTFTQSNPQPAALQRPMTGGLRRIAMLDVLRRRGRRWRLLAQYEEGRLGL